MIKPGSTFNRLTAIRKTGKDKHNHAIWLWRCQCGGTIETLAASVRSGRTKSCGCLYKETRIGSPKKKIIYSEGDEVFRCGTCGRFLSINVEAKTTSGCICLRCARNGKYFLKHCGAVIRKKPVLSQECMLDIYQKVQHVLKKSYHLRSYTTNAGFEIDEMPSLIIFHIIDHCWNYDPGKIHPIAYYRKVITGFLFSCYKKKVYRKEKGLNVKLKFKLYDENVPNAEDILCVIDEIIKRGDK